MTGIGQVTSDDVKQMTVDDIRRLIDEVQERVVVIRTIEMKADTSDPVRLETLQLYERLLVKLQSECDRRREARAFEDNKYGGIDVKKIEGVPR